MALQQVWLALAVEADTQEQADKFVTDYTLDSIQSLGWSVIKQAVMIKSVPHPKLFVWHGVLEDYTAGVAFAYAMTEADAREQLALAYKNSQLPNKVSLKDARKWVKKEMAFAPTVCDTPTGDFVYGGG